MSATPEVDVNGIGARMEARRASAHMSRTADSEWVERLARVGLLARGLVYVLIGVFAMQIALGHSTSHQANQQGAFAEIASKPFGQLLLWIVAFGFLGYALWQASDAIGGHHAVEGGKRTAKRAEAAVKAVIYLALAFSAVRTATGSSGGQGGQGITARLLGAPGGQLIVGLAGVAIAVAGCVQVWRGWKREFLQRMDLGRLDYRARRAVSRLGQFGYVARGMVFVVFGILVVSAAINFDPQKARGLDVALRELATKPFGSLLLVLAALGLICFGVFSVVEARYRQRAT